MRNWGIDSCCSTNTAQSSVKFEGFTCLATIGSMNFMVVVAPVTYGTVESSDAGDGQRLELKVDGCRTFFRACSRKKSVPCGFSVNGR